MNIAFRNIKLLLLLSLLVLLFVSMPTWATNLTVTCTPTMTNTDGTAIPTTATITYNLYGAQQGVPLLLLTPTPLTSCSSLRQNVNVGINCYAYTEIVGGQESAQTASVCKTVAPPIPTPPALPTITVSVPTAANTIYTLAKSPDMLVLLPAGTVPAGTQCDPSQSITQNGSTFNIVPHAAVTWTGTVKTLAAFAKCS